MQYVYQIANMQRLFITQFNFLFKVGYRNKNGLLFEKLKVRNNINFLCRWDRFVLSIH